MTSSDCWLFAGSALLVGSGLLFVGSGLLILPTPGAFVSKVGDSASSGP